MNGADLANGLASRAAVVLFIAGAIVVALLAGAFALGRNCSGDRVVVESAKTAETKTQTEKENVAAVQKAVTARARARRQVDHEVDVATSKEDLASYLFAHSDESAEHAAVRSRVGDANADSPSPVARSPPGRGQ